jgi:hypothetical protein
MGTSFYTDPQDPLTTRVFLPEQSYVAINGMFPCDVENPLLLFDKNCCPVC